MENHSIYKGIAQWFNTSAPLGGHVGRTACSRHAEHHLNTQHACGWWAAPTDPGGCPHTPTLRRLLLVARGDSWSTDAHRVWPTAFKQAVRTLLLSAHRLAQQPGSWPGGGGGGGGISSFERASRAARAARRAARRDSGAGGGAAGSSAATLGSLPIELLLQIAERAAFPVSSWM